MIDAIDHVVLTSSNLEKTLNFIAKFRMKLKKELIKEDDSRHSLLICNNKINIHLIK